MLTNILKYQSYLRVIHFNHLYYNSLIIITIIACQIGKGNGNTRKRKAVRVIYIYFYNYIRYNNVELSNKFQAGIKYDKIYCWTCVALFKNALGKQTAFIGFYSPSYYASAQKAGCLYISVLSVCLCVCLQCF